MNRDMTKKYEIRTVDGNYLQAGETENRKHIQIVTTKVLEDGQRMISAVVLLTARQWKDLCELRYNLEVEDSYNEESEDAFDA